MPLYEEKFICPFSIRFSQERIRPTFQDGRVVEKSMAAVEAVKWPIEDDDAYDVMLRTPFPPISIIRWRPKMREHDGTTITNEDGTVVLGEPCWFTFDNRRLYCLQAAAAKHWPRRAACVAHVMRDLPTNKCTPRKFRTTDSGNSVNISRRYDLVPKAVWSWCQATRCTAPGEVPDDADEATRAAHEHIMKDSHKEDWDELVDVPPSVEELCSTFEALEPLPQKPPLPPPARTPKGSGSSSASSSRQHKPAPQPESPHERPAPQPKAGLRPPNPLQYSQHLGYNFPLDFGMDYGYGFGPGLGNPYGALNGYHQAAATAAAAAAMGAAANGSGVNLAALAAMQQDLDMALAALHHTAASPFAAAGPSMAAAAAANRAAAARAAMSSSAGAAGAASRRKAPPEAKAKVPADSEQHRLGGESRATASASSRVSKSGESAAAGQPSARTSGAVAAAAAPAVGAAAATAAGSAPAASLDAASQESVSLLPVPKEGEATGDDDETCAQQ